MLQDRLCRGMSIQTSNYFITHLKAFGNWLVRSNRLAKNPFALLEKGKTETDRRHDRRELSADQMNELLERTRRSEREFRGLTGLDRFALYATAVGTGFRAAALG